MKAKVKNITGTYRINVLSRHPSHRELRRLLPRLPFKTVVRLGSTTVINDGYRRVECNSVQSVKNSANKRLMKQCFSRANVRTAQWTDRPNEAETFEFPIVAKHIYGSRGNGNTLIKSLEAFRTWIRGKEMNSYIFEKFYSYTREYRLHVTAEGCFYTCRKMLREGTPKGERWRRHDDTCVWILEDNPLFQKPNSWNDIVNDCKKGLNSIGADILSFDVKVQSNNRREYQDYIIIECNSASSMGEITLIKYLEMIPRILRNKHQIR